MIGLIPCAGHATRIHGLPKYLLPLGDSYLLAILVKRMFAAGVMHVYIGANSDNYEFVQRYAPEGCTVYLANTETMSETVLAARYYCGDEDVIMGMPDTYWQDDSLIERVAYLLESTAHVGVAGVFRIDEADRHRVGMVEFGGRMTNEIINIVDKPQRTDLVYGWGVLSWKPTFWQYINSDDPHVGHAATRACSQGKELEAAFGASPYYDCGEPNGYFECIESVRRIERMIAKAVNS